MYAGSNGLLDFCEKLDASPNVMAWISRQNFVAGSKFELAECRLTSLAETGPFLSGGGLLNATSGSAIHNFPGRPRVAFLWPQEQDDKKEEC